jgi:hypothetical protein
MSRGASGGFCFRPADQSLPLEITARNKPPGCPVFF